MISATCERIWPSWLLKRQPSNEGKCSGASSYDYTAAARKLKPCSASELSSVVKYFSSSASTRLLKICKSVCALSISLSFPTSSSLSGKDSGKFLTIVVAVLQTVSRSTCLSRACASLLKTWHWIKELRSAGLSWHRWLSSQQTS